MAAVPAASSTAVRRALLVALARSSGDSSVAMLETVRKLPPAVMAASSAALMVLPSWVLLPLVAFSRRAFSQM